MEVLLSKVSGPELEAQEQEDVLTLLRSVVMVMLKDQMKQQLVECRTAVLTGREKYRRGGKNGKFAKSTKGDLRREMEGLKLSFQNKTLALQRIQFAAALRNKVKSNNKDSRLIMETMKHIVNLSKGIIDYRQKGREKEEKLTDIRRKRFSLKQTTAEKLLQILPMIREPKEQQAKTRKNVVVEKIRGNLQKERHLTTVIQTVFQRIIIGSKINWAKDPSLRAVVLQLEKIPGLP